MGERRENGVGFLEYFIKEDSKFDLVFKVWEG